MDTKLEFDVLVIGGGPGGYIAAIRASQLGKKVGLVERERMGGVCLNKGCIPTKAMLKAAHSLHEVANMSEFGIEVELKKSDMSVAVKRASGISDKISKGVDFLMKKNKIQVISGEAKFLSPQEVEVTLAGKKQSIIAKNFIIATGAKYRTFPGLEHDGKRIIGAWEAVKWTEKPKSVGIIGAGAIGVEFAYFWNAFGVEVKIFEMQDRILPLEDDDSSKEIEKAYQKYGIKMQFGVKNLTAKNKGDSVEIQFEDKGATKKENFDLCLLAVGMIGNVDQIGLEKANIKVDKNFISVNEFYQTSSPHIYAIGDVAGAPLLAHAASHEGVVAAEHLSQKNPHAIDKMSIPACTYCWPEVASVGYTERALKEKGMEYSVGKIPFFSNGKAMASNEREGFIKVMLGKYGELLGAHIVGANATELIHEYVLMRTMEGIDDEIFASIHPHPTMGEFLAEAVLAARGRALNY